MNKKLLCTAVGAGLAAVSGLSQAQFDYGYYNAFVPYVVKDTNRTTVVSVIAGDSWEKDDVLHLQYWTKSTTDANTAACQPSSVTLPMTPNDILTFDTAGILGYPLFGDTTNPAPLGTGISYAAPRHGFLYIDGENDAYDLSATYWMELDLANGGAHSDVGLMTYSRDLSGTEFDDANILRADPVGSLSVAQPVVFWPTSVVSTVFTVTPLGTDMLNRENNQTVVQVFNINEVQGAYDRNENGVDGTVPITVRCVGRVTPAQLMPGVVANAAWAKQGGWGYLANIGDGDATAGEGQGGTNSGDLSAVIYQIDSTSAGGKFMSTATRIVTATE